MAFVNAFPETAIHPARRPRAIGECLAVSPWKLVNGIGQRTYLPSSDRCFKIVKVGSTELTNAYCSTPYGGFECICDHGTQLYQDITEDRGQPLRPFADGP
uniref:Uncharacterized protein n=1 Tax=Coccidioides posadasii RMSCC 3488 TaxID=454284 RepID=A0A0J6F3L9_COCPO|nr:hypothetical protein CPAG_01065 [Coccidioides posadasii RMSCC 3488]